MSYLIHFSIVFAAFTESQTKVLICGFHREQAWERWTKRKESTLTIDERQELLRLLRAIDYAPASSDSKCCPFKLAVDNLKASTVWKSKQNVQNYISQWWLSCPERWARAFRGNCLERNINTNNGAESLNKLMKYKFLKQSSEKTLCSIVSLIIEKFLPYLYREYITANVIARDDNGVRKYSSFVPSYLKGRPRAFIQHCLIRIRNSEMLT